MSRINGIRCDWCPATAELQGDNSLTAGWSKLFQHRDGDKDNAAFDLCPECTEAAVKAIAKASKYRRTGKRQR